MTQDFSALQTVNPDLSTVEPPAPLHWRTYRLPKTDPDYDSAIGWELRIDDLRGGYVQVGDFARGANLYDGDYRTTSESTLDQRWRRHLILPPLVSQQSWLTGRAPRAESMLWCYLNNVLHIATGGAGAGDGGHCLFNEYVTWGMVEVPYSPGDNITALGPITVGGVSAGERLFVGRQGNPPQILPAGGLLQGSPGTPVLTMHANLIAAYGILMSPANAATPGSQTTIIYANNGLWSIPITAAVTDPPTRVLANIPLGGCAIGVFQMPKGPYGLRMFWAFPTTNIGASAYNLGYFWPLKIVHTNLEGFDPVEVDMGLPNLRYVTVWQNKLVGSDSTRVNSFDGEDVIDLGVMNNRKADSSVKRNITGLFVKGGRDLCAVVSGADVTTLPSTAGRSYVQVDEYMPEMDAWMPASGNMPLKSLANCDLNNTWLAPWVNGRFHLQGPSVPWSKTSFYAYLMMCDSTAWNWLYAPPARHNPFYSVRQTVGDLSVRNMAQDFEYQGTWKGPYWELPQLEGRWKKVDQVVFMGDADAGGPGAFVSVSLNGNTPIVFPQGMLHGANVVQTSDTGDDGMWMQLQVTINLQRNSTLTSCMTPNGLPLMLRGRAYLTDPSTQVLGIPPGP